MIILPSFDSDPKNANWLMKLQEQVEAKERGWFADNPTNPHVAGSQGASTINLADVETRIAAGAGALEYAFGEKFPTEDTPGYLYHITFADRLAGIAEHGLVAAGAEAVFPSFSTGKNVSFAGNLKEAHYWLGLSTWNRYGQLKQRGQETAPRPILLRVRRENVRNPRKGYYYNPDTEINADSAAAKDLEIYGAGEWHPLPRAKERGWWADNPDNPHVAGSQGGVVVRSADIDEVIPNPNKMPEYPEDAPRDMYPPQAECERFNAALQKAFDKAEFVYRGIDHAHVAAAVEEIAKTGHIHGRGWFMGERRGEGESEDASFTIDPGVASSVGGGYRAVIEFRKDELTGLSPRKYSEGASNLIMAEQEVLGHNVTANLSSISRVVFRDYVGFDRGQKLTDTVEQLRREANKIASLGIPVVLALEGLPKDREKERGWWADNPTNPHIPGSQGGRATGADAIAMGIIDPKDPHAQELQSALASAEINLSHLKSLNRITTEVPRGYEEDFMYWARKGGTGGCVGFYDWENKVVHVHPTAMFTTPVVLRHEMGHHAFYSLPKDEQQAALEVGAQCQSEIRLFDDREMAQRWGLSYRIRSGAGEFWAEVYAMQRWGTKEQRANVAKLVNDVAGELKNTDQNAFKRAWQEMQKEGVQVKEIVAHEVEGGVEFVLEDVTVDPAILKAIPWCFVTEETKERGWFADNPENPHVPGSQGGASDLIDNTDPNKARIVQALKDAGIPAAHLATVEHISGHCPDKNYKERVWGWENVSGQPILGMWDKNAKTLYIRRAGGPEIMAAVVAHELGHAVMDSLDEETSNSLDRIATKIQHQHYKDDEETLARHGISEYASGARAGANEFWAEAYMTYRVGSNQMRQRLSATIEDAVEALSKGKGGKKIAVAWEALAEKFKELTALPERQGEGRLYRLASRANGNMIETALEPASEGSFTVREFPWLFVHVAIEDEKGGPGSGYFGHAGRPGEVGGSAEAGEVPATRITKFGQPYLSYPTRQRDDPALEERWQDAENRVYAALGQFGILRDNMHMSAVEIASGVGAEALEDTATALEALQAKGFEQQGRNQPHWEIQTNLGNDGFTPGVGSWVTGGGFIEISAAGVITRPDLLSDRTHSAYMYPGMKSVIYHEFGHAIQSRIDGDIAFTWQEGISELNHIVRHGREVSLTPTARSNDGPQEEFAENFALWMNGWEHVDERYVKLFEACARAWNVSEKGSRGARRVEAWQ